MLKLVTIAVMVVVTTAACAQSKSPERREPDIRSDYVEYVRVNAPARSGIIALTDDQLLHVGDGTCVALQNNPHTTPVLISNSYDERWPGAGSMLVGAALSYLCQGLVSRVDE